MTLAKKNPHQLFIISAISRPGFSAFMAEVEYTLYTPDTAKNAELELLLIDFPKGQSLVWAILIIPMKDQEVIFDIGKKYSFSFVKNKIPIVLDGTSIERFPFGMEENVVTVDGFSTDADAIRKNDLFWKDVIEKHSQGIPWKV